MCLFSVRDLQLQRSCPLKIPVQFIALYVSTGTVEVMMSLSQLVVLVCPSLSLLAPWFIAVWVNISIVACSYVSRE
jgi:hypothetical protein